MASALTRRSLLSGLVSVGGGLAALAVLPSVAAADPWQRDLSAPPIWVETNTADVVLRTDAGINSDKVAQVRAGTALRVLANGGEWTQVYEPRGGTVAYVHSDLIEPIDPPGPFIGMAPPPLDEDPLSTIAIATQDLPLYYYPSGDQRAQAMIAPASERDNIVGTYTADDGTTWYATDDGYFLAPDNVFLASDAEDFSGRWLDASLNGRARVTAYDNGDNVRSFYAVKGTANFPTPIGAWSIVRRVEDETMDSATVGIPRNAPNGYYLQHVLYTQYYKDTGESLHYNWWAAAQGQPGSHGCLGLSLADSKWLWDWAAIGTPVLVHP